MIGKTISHYKILSKLGEGGMGVVYKAEDTKLRRIVALKFLPPELTRDAEAKQRFIHEARAASALDHPNVCTIYEIDETKDGQTFMAMACYEGESLKEKINIGPLKLDEAIDIAIQIAKGLNKAHEKGIVHRDVKPANIFITEDGAVKILDFGLAKLSGQSKLTKTGTTLGTVSYMSPEQTKGEKIDERSDIWSLGVVLYEMLTGQRPFKGDYEQAVVYSIMSETQEPLTGQRTGVPMELERIVNKCLEKNPSERYPRTDDLIVDLRRLMKKTERGASYSVSHAKSKAEKKKTIAYALFGIIVVALIAVLIRFDVFKRSKPVSDADRKMLVVLPFDNLGPAEDAYFTVGITDEITSRLGTVPRIGVISRNSASHYAGKEWDTKQVGNDLSVEYIVAGTVRWARSSEDGDRVRITPRLIRVSDDIEVWAGSFDRIIHDIFEIQSEIAVQVVEQLGITLGKSEQRTIEEEATEHLEAYQAFLRGRHLSRSPHFTVDNWKRVIGSYQRAVELDTQYAVAYAALASAHARLRYLRHDLSEERLVMAKLAADRAEALGQDSPEVLLSLGYYYLWAFRDREQALQKWTLAEKGLPNDPRILSAKASLFENQGRWDEGIEALTKAIRYSPKDVYLITELVLFNWMKRQYSKAIELCNQAIALAPDENWPYIYKAVVTWNWKKPNTESRIAIESIRQDYHWVPWLWFWQEVGEGQFDQALKRLENNPDEWIRHKLWARPKSMFKAFLYDFMGKSDLARESYELSVAPLEAMVQKWPEDPRYHSSLGMAYAYLGRKDEAIREGRRAIELLPLSKDAAYGQSYEMDMILIYIITGDYDTALDRIEFLLSIPSWMSVGWMKFDLRYKPIYSHPRFEKLIRKYSGDH